MITVKETADVGYSARTKYNAKSADFTLAFAADFTTSGERLTKKFAGSNYLSINIKDDISDSVIKVYKALRDNNVETVNIAGNGVYTLVNKGYSQEYVDNYILEVLLAVHRAHPIIKIYTGCQTGADLAGARAAFKLDIDLEATLPNGYRQRNEKGQEVYSTHDEIVKQICVH